jgi:hypothetical protein
MDKTGSATGALLATFPVAEDDGSTPSIVPCITVDCVVLVCGAVLLAGSVTMHGTLYVKRTAYRGTLPVCMEA